MVRIAGPPAPDTLTPDQSARRQRIVLAALRVLAGSDYEHARISDVASESGVALGTLYRYFASKEHLFAAAFLEWQGVLKGKLDKSAPLGDSEAQRLRDVFGRVIRAFQLQPQFFGVMMMMQSTTDPYAAEIYQSIGDQFDDAVSSALDGPLDADRRAILVTVNSVLTIGLIGWYMKRLATKDVYAQVDRAIGLIYEFHP